MPITNTKNNAAEKPKVGEETGQQASSSQNGMFSFGSGGIYVQQNNGGGFDAPKPGTLDLYEQISRYPTVALVKSIVAAPIRANDYVWDLKKGTPRERLDTVKELLDPIRRSFVKENLRALEYGFTAGELVWENDGSYLTVTKYKPLRRQSTEALLDPHGEIVGLTNKPSNKDKVELFGAKMSWWAYDGLDGNPYGEPRNENIRVQYGQAQQVAERLAQFLTKVAGTTIQLHYPEGQSKDGAGALRPNFWLAQQVMDAVAARKCVMFPNLYAEIADKDDPHAMEIAAALAGKSQWVLSALDTGGGDHTGGMLDALKKYDEYFFAGWLRSPRTGLESTNGSRADATEHTDTGTLEAELVDQDICQAFQRILDYVLVLNWGPSAKGTVFVKPQPLTDNSVAGIIDLLKESMGNPAVATGIAKKMDIDAMLARADIPADLNEKGPVEIEKPQEPKPTNGTPVNGNGRMKEMV